MKKIVVIGSLNIDVVVGVDHMPAVGETILADDYTLIPGGKGANQAFALGRMGADVTMLGAVGRDAYGEMELQNLREAGVDVSHIARTDAATGMALISVNAAGNNSIVVLQGANLMVTREYIDSKMAVIEAADAVIFQLEIPLDTVVYAAAAAKRLGKTVILDPAPVPSNLPDELLRNVDILKPNEVELAALTGIADISSCLQEACDMLLNRGVGCVLASLGSAGAYVALRGGESRSFPCEPVQAVDTTAAGDSFTAATAFALANGRTIFSAVEFAGRIGSLVVTRKGAQSSIPTRDEVAAIWNS